jgi:tRNA A-37 threonylcarbamoyl transferase component Bud32
MEIRKEEATELKVTCAVCGFETSQCSCTIPIDTEQQSGSSNGKRPQGLLPVGSMFADKYRIDALIGEGGMSMVYRVTHEGMQKTLALKVLRSEIVDREVAVKRFEQEARASSHLSHPNLCTVHDYGISSDGCPYLVMDFLDGMDLSTKIKSDGRMPPSRVVELFPPVCEAVAYAHSKGVIHRDLKPSNIVIERIDGREIVKVVDFGIAKVTPAAGTEGNNLTQTGEIFGSPAYMSPEQCLGKKVDASSDIYSLGCVLYECLSGVPPQLGENPVQTILKHVHDAPPPFRPELNIPLSLQKVVFCCLEKNPADRYESADELCRDLEAVRGGKLALGQKKTRWYYFVAAMKRVKWYALIILSAVLIAMLAAVIVTDLADPEGMKRLAVKLIMNEEPWKYALVRARDAVARRLYPQAENRYKEALRLAVTAKEPRRAKLTTLLEQGQFFEEYQVVKGVNTLSAAIKAYTEARELALSIGTLAEKAKTCELLAGCKARYPGTEEEALKLYREAIDYRLQESESADRDFALGFDYETIGRIYLMRTKELDKIDALEVDILTKARDCFARHTEREDFARELEDVKSKLQFYEHGLAAQHKGKRGL